MRNFKLLLLTLFVAGCTTDSELIAQTCDRESVIVKNEVFHVNYSETLEQPLWVIYTSKNRPKNVDRGSMNFYTVDGICTSDNKDYYRNVYDKGHMAPAATFSDSYENLKLTFSYLNCSLQNQYLNRGEWRLLEEQERVWDETEDLTIKIIPVYSEGSVRLASRGVVPDAYHKHIKFETQKMIKCYYFLNDKPEKGWEEHDNTDKCDILEDFTF
jgi:DNA/RNA endonuclease G (NUC1)